MTPGTWSSDRGPGSGLRGGTKKSCATCWEEAAGRVAPRPEAAGWLFGNDLTCRSPSCFFLNPHPFDYPLRIQQWLEGAGKGERCSFGAGPSAPGDHSSCRKFWVFLRRVACHPSCQGKGAATAPQRPLAPSPVPEGPEPSSPLPVHLLQLLAQGAPLPRRVLLGGAKRGAPSPRSPARRRPQRAAPGLTRAPRPPPARRSLPALDR